MRILYLSQYFPPESGATQTRAYEMARGLVKAGHQVTMLAEFPNHPSGIIPLEYKGKVFERSNLDGIEVIRVWVKASPKKTFRSRMLFYSSYMFMAAIAGIFIARGKYDATYATSPPLFVGGAALVISYLRRIPMFFEVRDLWPESAVALGQLSNQRAIKWAKRLERKCYERSKRIVVVTKGIKQRLIDRGIPEEKLVLIPNGANTELFYPVPDLGDQMSERLGLTDKFIVLYAGIHGISQGLDGVIRAASYLKKNLVIHFVFLGEGPVKPQLMALDETMHLDNVTFLKEVARHEMPPYLSMADVALVPLRDIDLFSGAVPSKMFDSWACGCPTVITIPGEARRILEMAEAGVWVESENADVLAATLEKLSKDTRLCQVMGVNGRSFVEQHYSRQAQAKQLAELIESTLNNSHPSG